MDIKSTQKDFSWIFFTFFLLTLCAAGITTYTIYQYYKTYTKVTRTQTKNINNRVNQIIEEINTTLTNATDVLQLIADDFAVGKTTEEQLTQQLKEFLKTTDHFVATGIVYAPSMHENKLHSTIFFKPDNTIEKRTIHTFYDYTKTDWYEAAIAGKTRWIGPYHEPSTNTLILRYIIPLYSFDKKVRHKKFLGAITLDIDSNKFNDYVKTIGIGKQSYTIIVNQQGIVLVHPQKTNIIAQKTLSELSHQIGKNDFITLTSTIKKTGDGITSIYDGLTEKTYTAHFYTMPDTHWTVITMVPEQSYFLFSDTHRRQLIHLFLAVTLLLCLLFILFSKAYDSTLNHMWLASSLSTIVIIGMIVSIWTLEMISNAQEQHKNIIDNQADLEQFFFVQRGTQSQLYNKSSHFIPTGFFISSIDFENNDTQIAVNGYIWQKYPANKTIKHGVTMLNVDKESYEKVYEKTDNDITTIGWRFNIEYSSKLLYTKYPFDQQNIAINLSHIDYENAIILVPDFDAFTIIQNENPELDTELTVSQWGIKNTYFFYKLSNFLTDFGITDYIRQQGFPFLYFNIHIRRHFFDPFIINFLPIIIILFIVFSILLITGIKANQKGLATLIIRLSSGIFFAAAVAHQTFQRTVHAEEITYFEYFFFMLYTIILLTTINGMLYGSQKGGKFILYKENLLPRLLFWPSVVSLILIITLVFFY